MDTNFHEFGFLEKLLDGAEVEWKTLGEVGELVRGNGLQKKDFVEEGFPAIHYGQIYTKYGLFADRTFTYVTEELASKLRIARKNDLLLATTSENDEDVVKPLAWLGEKAAISGDMMLFRHQEDVKFLAYYFLTAAFQEQKRKYINGAKVRRVSKDNLSKIPIPIPPLHVQKEIVRILDTFTELTNELTTELTTELTNRKKQYHHYRQQLLQFTEHNAQCTVENAQFTEHNAQFTVEWKTLGEVGEFNYGYAAKAQDFGDARFVRITDIDTNGKLLPSKPKYVDITNENKRYILCKGDLLMARTGATYGKTMIFEESYPAIYAGFLIKLKFDKQVIIPKFYWHFAQSDLFWIQAKKMVSGGGQPQFNANALKEVMIPIPPLAEQARIVGILDKFDALTHSISEGLPREIELRQKQYAYYRDLLLSFPKPEEGTTYGHE